MYISLYYLYVCNQFFNRPVAQAATRLHLQLIQRGVSLLISMRIFPEDFLCWKFTETSLTSVDLIWIHASSTDQMMLWIFCLSLEAKIKLKMNNLHIFGGTRVFIISLQNKWHSCHFVTMEDDRDCEEINTEPETSNLNACSLCGREKNEDWPGTLKSGISSYSGACKMLTFWTHCWIQLPNFLCDRNITSFYDVYAIKTSSTWSYAGDNQ